MKQLLINLTLSVLLIFTPIKATLIAALVLIVIDLLAGIFASLKRKEKITSSGLKRTVLKILCYEVVICLSYVTQQYLTGELVPIVKIIAGLIGITELKSVLENIEEITGLPLIQLAIDKLSKSE